MLFYTWPFLLFMLVVLPGYFALRHTRFWVLWLLAASYFFYAWWNPYYLLLVIYSTTLDYLLVALMDHCPREESGQSLIGRLLHGPVRPPLAPSQIDHAHPPATPPPRPCATPAPTRSSRSRSASPRFARHLLATAAFGPATLRPAALALATLVLFMALGARLGSRRAWLVISIINNLALLLFFKYARFAEENLNQVLHWLHIAFRFPGPSTLMPLGWKYALPVGISFFTFQSMSYTIDFYLGKAPRERNILRSRRSSASFRSSWPGRSNGPGRCSRSSRKPRPSAWRT